MAKKAYCDMYLKSVAFVLRLREMPHAYGCVIHGDSAFASVACCMALLEHAWALLFRSFENSLQRNCKILHFRLVHGVETQLPFALLNLLEVPPSSYMVMYGLSLEVKVLQRSTWNHTLPVHDHMKKCCRLNPVSGESEIIMRTVPSHR